jgi:hypothetical protein
MTKITKVIVILITLIGTLFTISPVNSDNTLKIAAGPAYININNAFRNATYTETIFVYNQNNFNMTVELMVSGVIVDWVKFYETNNETNQINSANIRYNTDKPISCVINIPNDAANGAYLGFVKYSASQNVQDNETSNISKLVLSSTTTIYLNVTGDEDKNISIQKVEVNDVEMGMPLRFYFSINNNGNVMAYPVINISIFNKLGILLEIIQKSFKIVPGNILKRTIEWSTVGLIAENYTANIEITLDGKSYYYDDTSFRIYPIGDLYEWNATLKDIYYDGNLEKGNLLKIITEFRNLGEIETSAKFIGEVYLDGKFIDTIQSEDYSVKRYTTEFIETYIKLIENGNYKIKGYVIYSGIKTEEKTLKFTVESPILTTTSLIYLFILFIVIILLIFIYLVKQKKISFAIFKKLGKLRRYKIKPIKIKKRIRVRRRKIKFRRKVSKAKEKKPIKAKKVAKEKKLKIKTKPSKKKKTKKVKKQTKKKPLDIEEMSTEEIENYVKGL